MLTLSLLGLAIGLTTINAGTATAQGSVPADLGRNSALWAACAGMVAFLLGGYVAGRTAAMGDQGWSAFHGAMVFLVGVPLTLWLAGQGLGTILGSLGNVADALSSDLSQLRGSAADAQGAAGNVTPNQVAQAAERARNGAWGTLLGVLLGLSCAALGGLLSTHHRLPAWHRGQ